LLKKRYGQHFITDRNLLQRIVRFSGVQPSDTVIEVGPGAGALTRELAAAARRVVAIEIDKDLIPELRRNAASNVEIVEGDALMVDYCSLAGSPFRLAGNLPYNVAAPLIKRFISTRNQIIDATIMIQREVAERIRAKPGSRDYGPLSILVQYYATPVWGFTVRPGAFTPPPKVDSAVIRLEWKPNVPDFTEFTDFVQRAFSSRRKKLANTLSATLPSLSRAGIAGALEQADVSADARAETLSVEQFLRVYNRIREI
jgi:16S rRNA (adenine1518-N6/adenine1519-N6)-dimethyltransferase